MAVKMRGGSNQSSGGSFGVNPDFYCTKSAKNSVSDLCSYRFTLWTGVSGGFVVEVSRDSLFDKSEAVAFLLSAGFDDRDHSLEETASGRGLRTEADFSPNAERPQDPLGRVVGRFYSLHFDERPKSRAVLPELGAQASRFPVAFSSKE